MDEEDKVKGFLVSDIYATARWTFGSWGSPLIAEIHKEMKQTKHPLYSKPANFDNGWDAGVHENEELRQRPMTGNWSDDTFARNRAAMAMRPLAAGVTGGLLSIMEKHARLEKEQPWLFEPGKSPFE